MTALPMTTARLRLLRAVADLGEKGAEVTFPPNGYWRIGKSGEFARWWVWDDLSDAGLIKLTVADNGVPTHVVITEHGHKRLQAVKTSQKGVPETQYAQLYQQGERLRVTEDTRNRGGRVSPQHQRVLAGWTGRVEYYPDRTPHPDRGLFVCIRLDRGIGDGVAPGEAGYRVTIPQGVCERAPEPESEDGGADGRNRPDLAERQPDRPPLT